MSYSREYYAAHLEESAVRWRQYYATHKKEINAQKRKYRAANREHFAELRRKRYAAKGEVGRAESRVAYKKYLSRKRETLATRPRPSLCEICSDPQERGRALCFDHDHQTGEFRGWICGRCNTTMGKVNDDVDVLEKMIVYLMRARRPRLVVNSGS